MFWIFWATIWVRYRNACFGSIKVKGKDFGQLLYMERPNGNRETMEETAGVFLVVFIDIPQYALIRFVECLW